MNKQLLYPKTIDDLISKLNYLIETKQTNNKTTNILKWIDWFKEQNYELNYKCKSNEFLKAYYYDNNYSLQVWTHKDTIDVLEWVLLSKHYTEYATDITKIIN